MKNIKDKIVGIIIGLLMASGLVYAAISQEVLINVQGSGNLLNPIRVKDASTYNVAGVQLSPGFVFSSIAGFNSSTSLFYPISTSANGVLCVSISCIPDANAAYTSVRIIATTTAATTTVGYGPSAYGIMYGPDSTNTDDICISTVQTSVFTACPADGTFSSNIQIISPSDDKQRYSFSSQLTQIGNIRAVSRSGTQSLLVHMINQ